MSRDQNQADGPILGSMLPSYIRVSKRKAIKQIGIMEWKRQLGVWFQTFFTFTTNFGEDEPISDGLVQPPNQPRVSELHCSPLATWNHRQ